VVQLFEKDLHRFDPADLELFRLLLQLMTEPVLGYIENWKKKLLGDIENQTIMMYKILKRIVDKRKHDTIFSLLLKTNN